MKRRRSSARSSLLIGDDSTSKSSQTQQPSSSKLARASVEPSEDGNESNDVNSGAPHTAALKCQLAPTCNGRGNESVFENAADMERHHATYHTHVCLDSGCGKVFPDARFLALHQTECHDPLIDIRKERGEKTNRRLHLIEAHAYPAEFFFAITNKGIGGLLERWGEGVSLVRGKWKERSPKGDAVRDEDAMSTDGDGEEEEDRDAGKKKSVSPESSRQRIVPPPPSARALAPTPIQRDPPPHLKARGDFKVPTAPVAVPSVTAIPAQPATKPVAQPASKAPAPLTAKKDAMAVDEALDSLTSTMTSLSLVPRSVKFGRGKSAGFGQR